MISVAQEVARVQTTSASEVDLRFLVRKRTGPNSTPMALKTKESKDPGTRFSLLSYYWFCYSRPYCWDDNGDAKSNFGIWVRKFGIGQGMFQKKKNREKWEKVSLNIAKKKKPFEWMDILIPLEYDMRKGGKGILFCVFLCFVIYVRFKTLAC